MAIEQLHQNLTESNESGELPEPVLEFYVNSVLAARDEHNLATHKFNEMIEAGSVLLGIEADTVGDPHLKQRLQEVHSIYRGNGGA